MLRILAWTIFWPAVLASVLLGAAWWWAGTDDSLAAVLARASRYLPAGQVLQASEVTGSLRHGGSIGLLRWQNKGLTITARRVEVGWDVAVLLRSKLHLSHLRAAEIGIENTAPASSEPFAPPQSVVLPIEVDIPFAVGLLRWVGPPALEASELAGRYRYDGMRHALALDGVSIADGRYQAQATLLARAPLSLEASVAGTVQATIPGTTQTLALSAKASAQGPLASRDATLQVQASLDPAPGSMRQDAKRMQARGTASIQPWAPQPILRAAADFAGINLASLWPDMPQTLLEGTLQLQPEATGWAAQAKVENGASGPWDKQRVPLSSAQARVRHADGAWHVDSLAARAGAGELRGSGQWRGAPPSTREAPAWQARLDLRGVNPALFHTRLAPAALSGRANAQSSGNAVAFDVDLQPDARQAAGSPLQGLRLREVQAKGRWAAPLLNLSALKVRTDDALLQGQLELQTTSRAGRGDLRLSLPGGQASVRGQLAAAQGGGEFNLDLSDAAKAVRWLAQWPGVPATLAAASLQGQANLAGRWQGGWNDLQAGSPTARGGPTLQATLKVPRLVFQGAGQPGTDALAVRALRADLNGPLNAMDLKLDGELTQGTRRIQLQTQANGGRGPGNNEWHARIASLTLRLQDGARPGAWTAQLRQALALTLNMGANATQLTAGNGELALSGPVPGTARIQWEPLSWQQSGSATTLRSAGRIRDLPMAWLDTLLAASGTQMANLPMTGNMVFDGSWNLVATDTLRLEASLQRTSGDLSVFNEEASAGRIDAGVRQAQATLRTDGDSVHASLHWDSERAGQVEAEFSTRVSRGGDGWRWAADAPLNGKLQARLPRVGAWSMLAPPGWRMRGTLEANASLSGTRAAPQWSGNVLADDLALRSVVEGIELRDGRLRATLRGQRLELTEFVLRGAPVAGGGPTSGGMVTATGFAEWVPNAGLRSDVQAQAQALRASLRSDRRLVVSGQVRAQTEGPKLTVRGTLKADQAVFVLPEETAPSLGSDVVVLSRTAAPSSTPSAASAPAPTAPASDARSVDIAVTFDMGDDFRIQGRGLSTRLTGTLNLSSSGRAGTPPRVTGELRTASGSYRAYGQALDIEHGVLRFSGTYDNPALDVLAIRPNLTQRVGVQITGTALSPRIRLYAEPELPDAEKLAWLVLGRSAASGGAESAVLQQAALALLGGSGGGITGGLAKTLGLDELSVGGGVNSGNGSTTSSATITLGKRLSRNFYVAYERSLTGTLGSFYIFYDLSRRLTLRAQTGEKSAVDLIFTVPYD